MKKSRFAFAFLLFSLFVFSCATKPPKFDDSEFVPPQADTAVLPQLPAQDLPPLIPDEILLPREVQPSVEDSAATDGEELLPEEEAELVSETSEVVQPSAEPPQDFVLVEPQISRALPAVEMPPAPEPPLSPEPPAALELSPENVLEAASVGVESLPAQTEPLGGIWVDTPSYPYIAANSQPEPPQDIAPSRSVTMPSNRFLDVEYPGTGWIYLGENRGESLFAFTGRKLSGANTLFTLRAKKAGTSILHFYKQDLLNNSYIDDYLEVTVTDSKNAGAEHVNAPLYAVAVPPNQQKKSAASAQSSPLPESGAPVASPEVPPPEEKTVVEPVVTRQPTVVQTTESPPQAAESAVNFQTAAASPVPRSTNAAQTPQPSAASPQSPAASPQQTQQPARTEPPLQNLSPEELLKQAELAVKANEAAKALEYLDAYFSKAVGALDRGLFLRAQAYEAKTEMQNIRAAVEAYQTLMRQYPSSPLWKQANERLTYLNRFYFNIR